MKNADTQPPLPKKRKKVIDIANSAITQQMSPQVVRHMSNITFPNVTLPAMIRSQPTFISRRQFAFTTDTLFCKYFIVENHQPASQDTVVRNDMATKPQLQTPSVCHRIINC